MRRGVVLILYALCVNHLQEGRTFSSHPSLPLPVDMISTFSDIDPGMNCDLSEILVCWRFFSRKCCHTKIANQFLWTWRVTSLCFRVQGTAWHWKSSGSTRTMPRCWHACFQNWRLDSSQNSSCWRCSPINMVLPRIHMLIRYSYYYYIIYIYIIILSCLIIWHIIMLQFICSHVFSLVGLVSMLFVEMT